MALSTRWRLNISSTDNPPFATLAALQMATTLGGADVCTGGTASAESQWDATFSAANAFDGNASTRWANGPDPSPSLPDWLEYQFPSAVSIVEYRIQAANAFANGSPKNWTFEFWNGSAWVVIDTRWNEPSWTTGEVRTYTFATAALSRWRLNISAVQSGASASVATLQMASTASGTDLCTGGTARASSFWDATFGPALAFDGNAATRWNNGPSGSPTLPAWLEYQFASAVSIVEYRIQAPDTLPSAIPPRNWTFEYWDGSAWQVADTRTNENFPSPSLTRTFTVASSTTAQLSQLPIEALVLSDAAVPARLSQLPLEALVLFDAPIPAQLSQLPLEVLHSAIAAPVLAQLSQLPIEVLVLPPLVLPTEGQLSQLPVEVLLEGPPFVRAAELSATQLVTELASQQSTAAAVTQLPLEVAHHNLASAVHATQAVVEIARDRRGEPGVASVTQLLIEIIRRPMPPPEPEPRPPRVSACTSTLPLDRA